MVHLQIKFIFKTRNNLKQVGNQPSSVQSQNNLQKPSFPFTDVIRIKQIVVVIIVVIIVVVIVVVTDVVGDVHNSVNTFKV